jgi:hypothetical protein
MTPRLARPGTWSMNGGSSRSRPAIPPRIGDPPVMSARCRREPRTEPRCRPRGTDKVTAPITHGRAAAALPPNRLWGRSLVVDWPDAGRAVEQTSLLAGCSSACTRRSWCTGCAWRACRGGASTIFRHPIVGFAHDKPSRVRAVPSTHPSCRASRASTRTRRDRPRRRRKR